MEEQYDYEPSTEEKAYTRMLFEKAQKEVQRPIDTDFGLSQDLLTNEDLPNFIDYAQPIDRDAIKANVNPDELSATRITAIQSTMLAFYGKMLEIDLAPTQLQLIQVNSILNNSSRGKEGWAGYLSKTSKSVSETTLRDKAQEISMAQEGKSGLLGKLRR